MREFTLAEEPQKQDEDEVNDDRAQQFLDEGNGEMEHAVHYWCEDHAARILAFELANLDHRIGTMSFAAILPSIAIIE